MAEKTQKMSITERFNIIKSLFTGHVNPTLITMAQRFTPLYGQPPARSTSDWINLYNKSPRMNPIHQIASDVGTSAYGIYKMGDKRKTRIENSPIARLLTTPNPNPSITEFALFYITQVYLLLPTGEAFWIKERNGLGKVTELWPIPPSWVLEIPSVIRPFFTIYAQGNMYSKPIKVVPTDMVYFKKPDVWNPYLRGMGRANQVGDEIETDEYMAKWQKKYFFNNAVPPMVGMMPGADESTINRADEQWQQKYGGYNNSHKVGWLNWDAKFQILKETAKDMDFIESRKYLRDITNQHFSIPPELFGILENSNRSTIDAAYYLYTKNVLRKELKFIDDVLNRQLVNEFHDGVYLEHDNVVPEDEAFKLQKASEGLKNGGILVDEWRVANGWEKLPDDKGQILYVPLNMMATPMDSANATIPETTINPNPTIPDLDTQPDDEPVPDKGIKKKTLTLEMKNRIGKTMDIAAVKNERLFTNALKKYFQAQQDRLTPKLLKSQKDIYDISWGEEDPEFYDTLKPLWLASLAEGFNTANSNFGFGINFDVMNPKFLKWVKENGLDRVKDINNTTKESLRDTLNDGIENGESVPKLRDRIAAVYENAKGYRSTLIARTETITTVNAGSLDTYKSANVQQKEWLATIDNRTREAHVEINGEITNIDEAFSNGEMYPDEPNCRCTILPVLE